MHEPTEKEKRANRLIRELTTTAYLLVYEHEFSRERVHELVDKALDV